MRLNINGHSANDQKKRRDQFFCQLARRFFDEGQSEKDRWVDVPEVMRDVDCSEGEIKYFLQRLIDDGWIEVEDSAQATPIHARLTLAGKARAQVICKGFNVQLKTIHNFLS